MAMNRPTQVVPQPSTQESNPPQEVHPAIEEWAEMLDYLYALGYHAEKQTSYLKKLNELSVQLPTRMQADELLERTTHLEQMIEQAGKPKEKSFSLSSIKFPRLWLPRPDGPTWAVILMALAALLLLCWGLGGAWNNLSQLLR